MYVQALKYTYNTQIQLTTETSMSSTFWRREPPSVTTLGRVTVGASDIQKTYNHYIPQVNDGTQRTHKISSVETHGSDKEKT